MNPVVNVIEDEGPAEVIVELFQSALTFPIVVTVSIVGGTATGKWHNNIFSMI